MLERFLALGVLVAGCTAQIDGPPTATAGGSAAGGSTGGARSVAPAGTAGSPGGGTAGLAPGGGVAGFGAGSGAAAGASGSPPTTMAGAPSTTPPAQNPRVARLTHFQWKNSVQDLLGLEAPPPESEDFTPDAIIGFDTNAEQLRMSGALREDYESAAEALAARVAADPAALARLVPADAPTEPGARARAFIQSFGLKAYRRPLTEAEVDEYFELFQEGPRLAPGLDAFTAGIALCVRLFLQSPYFLYRTELGSEPVNGRIPLGGYELAAKLALAVTGSLPDERLLSLAAAGSLDPSQNAAALEAEAQRLLESPRGRASALHLQAQALALSRYALVQRDPQIYPEFKASTPASMQRSAELFLGALYDERRGLRALLTSTEAFVDANLAPIFGVAGTFGETFDRVELLGLPRRGLLTQPGILALFAGENQPDPIHRGVFINEQILCVKLGPPAPNIPPLPEPGENETNRQRIDALTGPGTCGQGCHATIINPIGFAFEHYDPLGRYRTTDGGVQVDASGAYALDGQPAPFADALELVELMAGSRQVHRCYASHWLSYLYGRLVAPGDGAALDALAARSLAEDLSSQDVIRSLVTSVAFFSREAGDQP